MNRTIHALVALCLTFGLVGCDERDEPTEFEAEARRIELAELLGVEPEDLEGLDEEDLEALEEAHDESLGPTPFLPCPPPPRPEVFHGTAPDGDASEPVDELRIPPPVGDPRPLGLRA